MAETNNVSFQADWDPKTETQIYSKMWHIRSSSVVEAESHDLGYWQFDDKLVND